MDHAVLPPPAIGPDADERRAPARRAVRRPAQPHRRRGVDSGIWSPFRSLLLGAGASARASGWSSGSSWPASSTPTTSGSRPRRSAPRPCSGSSPSSASAPLLIAELPLHERARQRTLMLRGLLVVAVASARRRAVVASLSRCCSSNLREALGDPIGATTFVLGVVGSPGRSSWTRRAAAAALRGAGRRATCWPPACASRSPPCLLLLGFTDAHVLQACWVLPLVVSIPVALWRLRLPRGADDQPACARTCARLRRLGVPQPRPSISRSPPAPSWCRSSPALPWPRSTTPSSRSPG